VVLCVHGLARNSRDFDFLAESLSSDCRVLCMDVVGRGDSDWLENKSGYTFSTYQADAAAMVARATAPVAAGLLRRLLNGKRQVTLDWLGTSMGGLIGMMLAAKAGSPIRRLVLNDVGPFIPWGALFRMKGYITRGKRFAGMKEVEAYLREACAALGPLTERQWRHLVRYSARRADDEGYVLRYDPAIEQGHGHIDREFPMGPDVFRGVDLWSTWGKVSCPTLALRGAESEVLLPRTLREMKQRKPDLQTAEFPYVGHAPALMSKDQIGVVKRFLLRK
jgi:pimeloyl-ACP methyl ester carboxylesterase